MESSEIPLLFSDGGYFDEEQAVERVGAPPPETFFLLQENGDAILQENNDNILLESAP